MWAPSQVGNALVRSLPGLNGRRLQPPRRAGSLLARRRALGSPGAQATPLKVQEVPVGTAWPPSSVHQAARAAGVNESEEWIHFGQSYTLREEEKASSAPDASSSAAAEPARRAAPSDAASEPRARGGVRPAPPAPAPPARGLRMLFASLGGQPSAEVLASCTR